jgi:hypothetical protein
MPDDSSAASSAPDDDDVPVVQELWTAPDHVLAGLVATVNRLAGTELGVTLYVGGTIISGVLISGRSYFDQLSEATARAADGEAFAEVFRHVAAGYLSGEGPAGTEADEPSEANSVRTAYLHLRATTVHVPGIAAAIEQGLWRGRLSAVDGWAFGNLVPKPPPAS